MYIINHSCRTEPLFLQQLLDWIPEYFGRVAAPHGNDYRVSRLLAPSSVEGGEIVIVQLFVDSKPEDPTTLLDTYQDQFQAALFERFSGNVLAFLTLMDLLEKDE